MTRYMRDVETGQVALTDPRVKIDDWYQEPVWEPVTVLTDTELDTLLWQTIADTLRTFTEFYAANPDAVDDETPADLRNFLRETADRFEKGESL